MASQTLDILLRARSEGLQEYQRHAEGVRKMYQDASKAKADAMRSSVGGGAGGLFGGGNGERSELEQLARIFGMVGKIKIGIDAMNVAIAVGRGDWEKAAETVQKLPFGIGEAARSLNTLLGSVTGIADEMERAKKETAEIDKIIKSQKALNAAATGAANALGKMAAAEDRKKQLAGLTGRDLRLALAEDERKGAVEQIVAAQNTELDKAVGEAIKEITAKRGELRAVESELSKYEADRAKLLETVERQRKQGISPGAAQQFRLDQYQALEAERNTIRARIAALEQTVSIATQKTIAPALQAYASSSGRIDDASLRADAADEAAQREKQSKADDEHLAYWKKLGEEQRAFEAGNDDLIQQIRMEMEDRRILADIAKQELTIGREGADILRQKFILQHELTRDVEAMGKILKDPSVSEAQKSAVRDLIEMREALGTQKLKDLKFATSPVPREPGQSFLFSKEDIDDVRYGRGSGGNASYAGARGEMRGGFGPYSANGFAAGVSNLEMTLGASKGASPVEAQKATKEEIQKTNQLLRDLLKLTEKVLRKPTMSGRFLDESMV